MQARDDFEAKRADSKRYEIAVSNWLQRARKYFIIPAYDYSGLGDNKAPRMMCGKQGLVLPDLFGAKLASLAWFEVKLKEQAVVYRKTNTRVTGFSFRHWEHYKQVKLHTNAPVYILFIHRQENVVKYEEIDSLPFANQDNRSVMGKGGMIFFDFDKLRTLMTVTELMRYAA